MVQEELILNIRANADQGIKAFNEMKRAVVNFQSAAQKIAPNKSFFDVNSAVSGFQRMSSSFANRRSGDGFADPNSIDAMYSSLGALRSIRREMNLINSKPVDTATKSFTKFEHLTTTLQKSNFGMNMWHQMKPFMDQSFIAVPHLTQQLDSLGAHSLNIGKQGAQAFNQLNSSMMTWSSSLAGVSGQLNQVFGALGYGMVLAETINAAKIRESNKMFLELNIDDGSAQEAYNKIQDLVIRLPGNDQFLTSILTLSKAQQPGMSDSDLDKLGVATAEYYAAANAKGQFTYETEKELRGYLMSGNTLAFKNSMIAQEIDLLKNQNTITERAIALEEALRRTGFDGMATMESYANIFERFKGRIEKGFADIGDLILPLLKGFYNLYNAIDAITMSGLTDVILLLVTGVGLFSVAMTGLSLGFNLVSSGVAVATDGVRMFSTYLPSLRAMLNGTTTATQVFASAATSAVATESQLARARVALHSDAYLKATRAAYDPNVIRKYRREMQEMARLRTLGTGRIDNLTNEKLAYVATVNGINVNKLSEKHFTDDLVKTLNKDMKPVQLEAAVAEAGWSMDTYQKNLNTLATKENSISELENAEVRRLTYGQKVANWRMDTKSRLATLLDTDAKVANASATEVQTLAEEGNILAKIRSVAYTRFKAIATWADTTSENANTISVFGNLKARILGNLERVKNFAINLKLAASNIWLAITQAAENAELSLTAVLMAIINSELFIAVAAIAAFVLIFEKIGEWLGYWDDFGSMIEAIQAGLKRVWDAFVNSKPVQTFVGLLQSIWTLVTGLFSIPGNIIGYMFPSDGRETFDILGSLLEIIGTIGNVLLFPITTLFTTINQLIELLMDGWDKFVQSTQFDTIVEEFRNVWSEVSKPIGEIFEVINEIGRLWGEIWGDEELQGAKETVNVISQVIGAIAWVLTSVLVPTIKFIGFVVEGVLMQIKPFLDAIKWILEVTSQQEKNDNYVGQTQSYDSDLANRYVSSTNLTNNSSNLYTTDNSTVIVNNYEEGSIPVDARNYTKEEAQGILVTALGYDKVYNTGGVTR